MKKVRKAIIPAAGLGTRFLPATKAMPKEMLPIVDKPTIQYIVEEAVKSGIEDIIIVTGKTKRSIEDHFDNAFELEQNLLEKKKYELLEKVQASSKMVDIHYIRQKEPKGLGHAVWCARKFIGDEPFAVLLGDDTVIIPLLNGIAHLSLLQKEFGEEKVIGGLCFIETTLNDQGEIVQTSAANRLVFGEIKSQNSERVKHISKAFAGTKSSFVLS
ncbi:sugar phosphate nucleotidyltransferase, partial [Bacillus sp. HC-TM]